MTPSTSGTTEGCLLRFSADPSQHPDITASRDFIGAAVARLDLVDFSHNGVALDQAGLFHVFDNEISEHLESARSKGYPDDGHLFSFRARDPCRAPVGIYTTIGTQPGAVLSSVAHGVDLPTSLKQAPSLPEIESLLREGIQLLSPYYAALEDSGGASRLDHYSLMRSKAACRLGDRTDPVIIHWKTFLRRDILTHHLAGREPTELGAASLEEIGDGILISLTEEPLDNENRKHRAVQENAMKLLRLPVHS